MLLMRLAVLASGTGFILTPRRWLARMKDRVVARRLHLNSEEQRSATRRS
jgi:hypothetical protein